MFPGICLKKAVTIFIEIKGYKRLQNWGQKRKICDHLDPLCHDRHKISILKKIEV